MIAVKPNTLLLHLHSKIVPFRRSRNVFMLCQSLQEERFANRTDCKLQHIQSRANAKQFAVQVVASGLEDLEVSSCQSEGFSVTTRCTSNPNELKISVEVSGPRTRETFDSIFLEMVAEAQPIPGFRRVKGGKTPNIPENILLEILGPSKVYKQVIKKIINSTVAEFVSKEGLAISNDLQIQQSCEDLEAVFEPGVTFKFDAIICVQASS